MRHIVKFIVVLSIVFAGTFIARIKKTPPPTSNAYLLGTTDSTLESHKLIFYEPKSFLQSVAKVSSEDVKPGYQLKGGIIPHHLFPSDMLAKFFRRLQYQQIDTIVLIGPNHHERGGHEVLTSFLNWDTPFGVTQTNNQAVKILVDKQIAYIDDYAMENDHSVAGMMPFIKYFLPNTSVVPILLKAGVDEKESNLLASTLAQLNSEYTVIIAPVDFSHYLTSLQAKEKDKVSWQTITDFNYSTLYRMNNDYLDSPASIGVLLMTMQKLQTTHIDLYENTNSGEMIEDPSVSTTSYFSVGFY